jgi:mRNA degradation ribonuclease J1/J2
MMAQSELVFRAARRHRRDRDESLDLRLRRRRRRQWLIVDCGVSFASEEHLPGVDLILPDIRFLIEERKNIVGLVLTHGHEDHMGALIDLWPRLNVPLYATPFTAALFEAKRLSEPGAPKFRSTSCRSAGGLTLGPFTIDFINVAHSIPESNALAIRTPLGTVLHTGDWKIDPPRSSARRPTRPSSRRSATRACWRSSAIPPMRSATAARRRKPMWPKRWPNSSAPRRAASR